MARAAEDSQAQKFQLALAVTIVKSKPAELTVREYIAELRPYIRYPQKSPLSISESPTHRYLDVTSYWRDKHHHDAALVQELQDQVAEQRFHLDRLRREKSIIEEDQSNAPQQPQLSNSNKRRTNANVSQSPTKKRKYTQPVDESNIDDDLSSLSSSVSQLARDLFIRNLKLHRLVEGNNAFLALDLGHALQRTTKAAADLITKAAVDSPTTRTGRSKTIIDEATSRLLSLTVSNVFEAFERLVVHRISPDQEIQNPLGAAIYSIVKLFRSCLECLQAAISSTVQYGILQTKAPSASTASSKRSSTSTTTLSTTTDTSSEDLIAYLKDIMKKILTSVSELQSQRKRANPCSVAHSSLLEGLQHLLVTAAGRLLYTLTFSSPRLDSVVEELENLRRSSCPSEQTQELRAASAEAHHIFPLLKLALAASASDSSRKRKTNSKVPESSVQRVMTAQPLLRVKKTLIQGVFGITDEDDLEDALKLPAEVMLKGTRRMERKDDETEVGLREEGDRFIKQMWELCGWDFLMKPE